jgi:microcystin-dependent protein
MSDPFIGEIRPWAMSWAPRGWAACNGQQIPIYQAQALFAITANLYGPSNTQTFYLPDLRSKVPMAAGSPNASWVAAGMPAQVPVGQQLGTPSVTLTQSSIPNHTHQAMGATTANLEPMVGTPTSDSYVSRLSAPGTGSGPPAVYAAWNTQQNPNQQMHPAMIGVTGSGNPHQNQQPFLTVNFCIALMGVYPPRPD